MGVGFVGCRDQVFVEAFDTLMQVGTIVQERCWWTWISEEVKEILENQRDFFR